MEIFLFTYDCRNNEKGDADMNEDAGRRRILDLRYPMDHEAVMSILNEFAERYSCLSVTVMGQSVLGRSIPMLCLGDPKNEGEARRRILYIGAHHGSEWITTSVLLRFVNEYCELFCSDGMAEGIRVKRLAEKRDIYLVPMLNPDGVEYAIHGVSADNVLHERVLRMNGGSEDFSHWQANARGVDLNHNYNAGFAEYKQLEAANGIDGGPTRFSGESPESEPETAYLCNYLRFCRPFDGALSLHTQGEEIYYTSGEVTADNSLTLGKYLARVTGYTLSKPEGLAAYGGFTDWFIRAFEKPSFTLECGKGSNPLPISDMPMIYLKLRRALFAFPMVV